MPKWQVRKDPEWALNPNLAYLMHCAGLSDPRQLPALCQQINEELEGEHMEAGPLIINNNWIVGCGWVIPWYHLRGIFGYFEDRGTTSYWVVAIAALGGFGLEIDYSRNRGNIVAHSNDLPPVDTKLYAQLRQLFPKVPHTCSRSHHPAEKQEVKQELRRVIDDALLEWWELGYPDIYKSR